MDRLTVMRCLVAAGEAGSFSAAARSLGVSNSHISRQIAALESELDVRLVNRESMSVTLTPEGRHYVEFSERILRQLDEQDLALAEVHTRPEGDLAILSPKWIGSLDLAQATGAFCARHPLIKVRFDVGVGGRSARMYDFIEEGYDVSFHTHELRDSSVRFRRVATLPFVLCASPEYLSQHGMPTDARSFKGHRCIMHRDEPTWHLLDADRSFHHKVLRPVFSSNTYLVMQKAAAEGLGIAMLPLASVLEDVQQGRLAVIGTVTVPARPLYAVYPPGLQSMERLRLFLDFIAAWYGARGLATQGR
jgi:DNA-binding transcriptional LysR family regulator